MFGKLGEILKPEKVEWKKLKEVTKSLKKQTVKQTLLIKDGLYPVINSSRDFYGFLNDYNNDCQAITIASRGEYAGFINNISGKFFAGGLCYPYTSFNENILKTKFLYYFLKKQENIIMDVLVLKGSIPALNKEYIDNFPIPIPPLSTQQKIVEILDKFTELEKELLPYGCRLLSYMQTVRFFTDYLNGDTYYKIAYPEHNIVRTRAQLRLVEEQEKVADEMTKIIKKLSV